MYDRFQFIFFTFILVMFNALHPIRTVHGPTVMMLLCVLPTNRTVFYGTFDFLFTETLTNKKPPFNYSVSFIFRCHFCLLWFYYYSINQATRLHLEYIRCYCLLLIHFIVVGALSKVPPADCGSLKLQRKRLICHFHCNQCVWVCVCARIVCASI